MNKTLKYDKNNSILSISIILFMQIKNIFSYRNLRDKFFEFKTETLL